MAMIMANTAKRTLFGRLIVGMRSPPFALVYVAQKVADGVSFWAVFWGETCLLVCDGVDPGAQCGNGHAVGSNETEPWEPPTRVDTLRLSQAWDRRDRRGRLVGMTDLPHISRGLSVPLPELRVDGGR